ncbi:Preprotein translocase Sec, Sec61-beta subunit [Corchorus olitorius]|uniref:Preprotein translocase Sec, Sec61-beta subunit n=1 Tax=Corchorus olitorius TaxID=93759 RepID=A0A1R3KQZ8_9ROSI|nr:Preprotein translocase Sec, Sec61-beta subunit [Corchorus olitorius]
MARGSSQSQSSTSASGSRPGVVAPRGSAAAAAGLKISPTVVLVMSLCFIGFVTALHVFGKLYRAKTGAGP